MSSITDEKLWQGPNASTEPIRGKCEIQFNPKEIVMPSKSKTSSPSKDHPTGVKKEIVTSPPKPVKNKDPKPEILFGESRAGFHVRAIHWLVKNYAGATYAEIVRQMFLDFDGTELSKEVASSSLKILERRGWVAGVIISGEDKRRVKWYNVSR